MFFCLDLFDFCLGICRNVEAFGYLATALSLFWVHIRRGKDNAERAVLAPFGVREKPASKVVTGVPPAVGMQPVDGTIYSSMTYPTFVRTALCVVAPAVFHVLMKNGLRNARCFSCMRCEAWKPVPADELGRST